MIQEIKQRCIREAPYIWVSRLVVFERCEPEPKIIRDIRLSRGLNILWAEEPDENDVVTPIAGHSAGKTTFCRFLRYVLGETTYANQKNAKLIRSAFPNGYVAAEIYIEGKLWSVRRPIGNGRLSYIAQDLTIEQLIEAGGRSVPQDKYVERLGINSLMDRLETAGIAKSGETIQWGHLLAWMTRDQESRFQSIHEWRSPRSDSNTPSFRYPRSGALFVMRAALGLFRPEELRGEEQLTVLYKELEQLEKETDEKRREPQYRANLRISQLREKVQNIFAEDNSIASLPLREPLLPDLLKRAADGLAIIDKQIFNLEQQDQATQQAIDEKNAELKERQSLKEKLDTAKAQANDVSDQASSGLSNRRNQMAKLSENQEAECDMAQILIKNCSYVKDLFSKLDRASAKDEHEYEQLEARSVQQRQRFDERVREIESRITHLQEELVKLRVQRTQYQKELPEMRLLRSYIAERRVALENWCEAPLSTDDFKELNALEQALADKRDEIQKKENHLNELIREHQANQDMLAGIFSMCVRSVIRAPGYDGKVDFTNRELNFQLSNGTAMSGEAVETLAILLADMSSVLFNCVSKGSNLPGFLLHDSPREADLGLRLYRSFISFIAELEKVFGGADQCPFQYILTTTSPPPRDLREPPTRKDRFSALTENELFLRRDISSTNPVELEPYLFSDESPQ
ncbi:MAG TPA: hypothetical protein DCZ95_16750 [Verrucomicrobia bacterium]|nr:MAG: hypothetical protein A2X46_14645 [Lentisphaerae bacterium GWF2_57_35]HBA85733.1 hypothetical protein [Verrucomicrobiota bacterium]